MVNLDNQNLQPEDSGIKARPVLMFLLVLGGLTVFVFVMIRGLLWGFDKLDQANTPVPATMMTPPNGRILPPEPILQGAPGPGSNATTNVPSMLPLDDMKAYREKMDERMKGYGWVDQNAGVGYMPIEEAKRRMIEQGLPVKADAVAGMEKAQTVRGEMLNSDANSGRLIESGARVADATPMVNQGGNAAEAGGASPQAGGASQEGVKPTEARPFPVLPNANPQGGTNPKPPQQQH